MKFSTLFIIALLFALSIQPLVAQRPAIAPAPTPVPADSTTQLRSPTDTIPPSVQRNGLSGVPVRVGSSILTPDADSATLASDTVQVTPKQEAEIRKIIPRKATIRSLMLPGLGQAYNRQYYKIPFIYAGFGVMGYLYIRYRGLAKEAEDGYRLLLYGGPFYGNKAPGIVPDAIAKPTLIPGQYQKVESVIIGDQVIRTTTGAKAGYDLYRRYRDLNLLLSAALWAVNIIEANVAAHLKTFDLTDDISMRVEPNVLAMPGTGFVPGVRVAFTFK